MPAAAFSFAAVTATSRYPPCAMLEYASIRFTFVCPSAMRLATTMVIAASHHRIGIQSSYAASKATTKTRRNATNAAAFTADDMNAVTGAGAPSYTSGVHMWNGTAETLNEKPIARSAIAITRRPGVAAPLVTLASITVTLVLPVAPYVRAMP